MFLIFLFFFTSVFDFFSCFVFLGALFFSCFLHLFNFLNVLILFFVCADLFIFSFFSCHDVLFFCVLICVHFLFFPFGWLAELYSLDDSFRSPHLSQRHRNISDAC